jgi:DNA-binding NarL/FixJ family response regulator
LKKESKIRVLIADDHPLFRSGLRQAIEAGADLEIVAEAVDGAGALAAIRKERPDVAVLDVAMPKLNGFRVAQHVNDEKLPVRILFLTMYDEEDMFNEAMNCGALGYVLKETAINDILSAIRSVAAGKHYLSPSISQFLMRRLSGRESLRQRLPGINDLTEAERRVVRLIAEDKTSKEIASVLDISFRTVETHRANICAKLDLRGSHSLLRFAFDHRQEL